MLEATIRDPNDDSDDGYYRTFAGQNLLEIAQKIIAYVEYNREMEAKYQAMLKAKQAERDALYGPQSRSHWGIYAL